MGICGSKTAHPISDPDVSSEKDTQELNVDAKERSRAIDADIKRDSNKWVFTSSGRSCIADQNDPLADGYTSFYFWECVSFTIILFSSS